MINLFSFCSYIALFVWIIGSFNPVRAQTSASATTEAMSTTDGAVPRYNRTATIARFPRVVLLVFENTDEAVLGIVEALQLRMFDVDIKFGTRWIKPPTDDYVSQVHTAHSLLAEENIQLAIFWNSRHRDTLYYLIQGADTPMERTIHDVGNESRPEAIAIVVQTAVESLLDTNQLKHASSPAPPPVNATAETQVPPFDSERRSIKENTSKDKYRSPKGRFPNLYFQMGYEMNAANTLPTILHGGNFRIGYQPAPAFRGFLGVGIVAQKTSSEQNFEVKQLRLPIELGILGRSIHGKLAFGGGASFLLVPLRNSPGAQYTAADMKETYWTRGMMLRAFVECSYYIHKKIELFASFHLLLDLNMVTYNVQNGPVLFDEYNRLWPGLQAGITFLLF